MNVSNSQLDGGYTPVPGFFTSAETGCFYISFAEVYNNFGFFNRNSNNTPGVGGDWTGCLFYNTQRTSAVGNGLFPNITNSTILYAEYPGGTNTITLYAVSSNTDWDISGGETVAPLNVNYSLNIEILNDGGTNASISANISVVSPFTFTPF